MFEMQHLPLAPESFFLPPAPESSEKRRRAWPRVIVAAGLVACAVALGAGDFVGTAVGMEHFGWGQGARMAMVQHVVAHALDSVGATSAQEAKAHDIVAAKFAEMGSDTDQADAMRKHALELLSAPTLDRGAVEALRAAIIARLDAKSKLITGGILDIADLLTPAQRAQLATQLESMHAMGHGPMGDGPMGGRPDSAPDKD